MISELTEEEILDFLMTSDFENEFKPDEFKYLLLKWRYFYRVIHGKYELLKTDSSYDVSKLEENIKFLEKEITSLQTMLTEKNEDLTQIKSRKLSLKERLSGKINLD
jgi:hypothetical protein